MSKLNELSEEIAYGGLSIDLSFEKTKPSFGDLFEICGSQNPNFPPSGEFGFARFKELRFSQVDDYFGVRTQTDKGDDVAVWLYPLIENQPVHHNVGLFDGLRLVYNVMRHPGERFEHFALVVKQLIEGLPVLARYSSDFWPDLEPLLERLRVDFKLIKLYWERRNIEIGSNEALEIDC